MKKRILSLLLVFVLIVALLLAGTITTLAAPAEAQTKSPEDEIVTYPVPGGSILFDPATGAVTGYEGAIVELSIPAEINGVDVVTIRNGAFDNCVSLSSVVLPDSLTTIEEFAFANCFFLTSVELPDSLTSLEAYTFTCCADITSITIPDSVMTIGAGAFSGCPMLEGIWVGENNPNYCSDENGVLFNKDKTELVAYPGALAGEYVIPDSVTTIGDSAFSLCDNLIGITIPDSVTSIDDNAFENCYNLTEVVIPGSVPTIGEYAFAFCGSLTDIIIQEGVTTIGDGAFQNCYGLTDVTIPGSVSYVGATSFLNCGNLIDVTIPEGVTTIGAMAFDSCYSLSSIEIPASVTTIGFDVFYACYNLTDIYYGGSEEQWNKIDLVDYDFSSVNIHFNSTMPELVSYPVPGGSILFDPATGTVTGYDGEITEVEIPSEINGVPVVAIGERAFRSCLSMTEVSLPDGLLSIGEDAFGWSALTRIDIPASVTTIGSYAFSGCENLEGIWVSESNLNYSSDSNGILFNKDKTVFVAYLDSLVGDYVIPDSVRIIEAHAFSCCDSLTGITFPDSVTAIGTYAFESCINLTTITIPYSITVIDEWAFIGCNNLTDIYYCGLQAQWEAFNLYFFSNPAIHFSAIEYPVTGGSIYFDPLTGTVIGFEGEITELNIPAEINGVPVTAIGGDPFCDVYNLIRVTIPDSVITIGSGAFSDCTALEGIWVDENNPNYCSDESGVLFNKDKTELVAYPGALGGSYIIPDSVTTISDYAFYNCYNLTAITFPDNLKTIGEYAFWLCGELNSIVFPDTLTSIGNYAFNSCYNLTAIAFPDNLKTIGNNAFAGCNFSSIVLPDSLTFIGDYAFAVCEGLTSITLPNNLKTISHGAFESCENLSFLTIPNGVITIGSYAFNMCWNLESVEIPASVTSIGNSAFFDCVALKGIWVDENNINYSSDKNGVLFNKNKSELIICPRALGGSYTVPDGVTTIDDYAFENCYNLTAITIPDSLTSIGEYAFSNCESLSSITLPNNLKTISLGAFAGCEALTFLTIPNGVTTIGNIAFKWCWNLENIAIPDSVTFIGYEMFDECPNLTNIYYGGSQAQWEQLTRYLYFYNDFSGITVHYNETAPWHDCPSNDFADIPFFNNWAHNGIDYCVEQELMNGVGNNLFNPNGTVSRGQLVTILYRMAGSPETEFKGTFTDVANGKWYSKAIEWAAANGIVNGVGNGKFAPDQSITREQIATILYRYHGSPTVSGNLNSFPDAGSVSGFARNGLLWATQEKLINGVSSGGITSLAPKANATRAQIAAIIMRYCKSI